MTFAEHMTVAARSYLVGLLDECSGNVAETARRAGLGRQYTFGILRKLGLRGADFRPTRHVRPATGKAPLKRRFKIWTGGRWGMRL